jgi:hypothetical protein
VNSTATKEFSTALTEPERRSRHWHEAIASAYFPLDLEFRDPDRFSGELKIWQLGEVSLSRLTSEALRYQRLSRHFLHEREEHFLVTVPAKSEIFFAQCAAIRAGLSSSVVMSRMSSAMPRRLIYGS